MEQQNMDQVNPTAEPKKRPQFLMVLCILSFIGIGFGIWLNLITLATDMNHINTLQSTQGVVKFYFDNFRIIINLFLFPEELGNSIIVPVKSVQTFHIIDIVSLIICFVGVLMMWKLKKAGYFIYIITQIIPAIVIFILLGGFGSIGTLAIVSGLILPIAFIIMYGLNLKHMS